MILTANIILLFLLFAALVAMKNNHVSMSKRVMLSLALGTTYGLVAKLSLPYTLFDKLENVLELVGYGYLALLKMLVIPLILTSIIHAILNLDTGDSQTLKKMSAVTCGLLLGMTAISSLIGLLVAEAFGVGKGMMMPIIAGGPAHTYHNITDTLLGMIPSNPVAVMANGNTVAIVLFAMMLGIAARSLDKADHDKMQTFRQLIASLFAIVKQLAQLILRLTPYAILTLMALMVLKQGMALLTGILNFAAAMYVAMFLVLVMHSMLVMVFGYHPIEYFKHASAPLLVALTTRSSFGTLPVTEEVLRNKFKTSQVVASFTPSLGATLGMNACAGVYPAVLIVMAMNILHMPLTVNMALSVMAVNTLASLGISGIPGTGYIAATISLTSLNLPYATIALVQGIDPIIDMGRTATNVNGTIATALVTQRVTGKELAEPQTTSIQAS